MKSLSCWKGTFLVLVLCPVLVMSNFTEMYKIFNPDAQLVGAFPLGFIPGNTTLDVSMRTINGDIVGIQFTFSFYNSQQQLINSMSRTCAANANFCQKQILVTTGINLHIVLIPTGANAALIPYYLTVISYTGTTLSSNSQVSQLLKVTEARIGGGFIKYFYVLKGTYNMTAALLPTNPGATLFDVALFNQTTLRDIQPVSLLPGYPLYSNKVQTVSYALTTGLHAFNVYKSSTPPNQLFITWPGISYPCPYDPAYVDFYNNFKGCYHSNAQQGFPCSVFDKAAQLCRQCLAGYTLDPQTGSCLANTTCPPRQYFHFGTCFTVDDKCKDFDPFTGNCLTCSNDSLTLNGGVCLPKTVLCSDRQWQSGAECRDISENCATFDRANGNCLTCKNYTFELANGSCVPVVVVCPPGQFEYNLGCLPIPAECLKFDTANLVCLSCIQGYFVQDGQCQRVVCPPLQAPSRFGLFCVDVSPLCGEFDPLNGACLSCKVPNHRVNSAGICVQFNSPLAGCKEREKLGFGACLNAEKDCKAYNLVTGNCEVCETGFFLDFTGRCQREAQCGAGKWSLNGECVGIAENCLRVDSAGLCASCVNADYRLEGGQCVRFKRCAAAQFLNAGGECVDVSSECGLFNPSNGECVTCKSGANPRLGRCCKADLVFDGRSCVSESGLQKLFSTLKGSECLAVHPSLGHCLSCNRGFTPDPITQKTCIQE